MKLSLWRFIRVQSAFYQTPGGDLVKSEPGDKL